MISIGKIKQLIFNLIRKKISWLAVWTQRAYQKGDQVTDNGWVMVANRATDDIASPQTVGNPIFTLPDVPAWTTNNNVSVVYSGQRYVFTDEGWVTQIRVWAPVLGVNVKYSIVIIDNTNPSEPVTTIVRDPTLISNDWTIISLGSAIVGAGSDIIVFLAAENSSTTSTWNGTWRYDGTANIIPPGAEGWNRRNQNDTVRIDNDDLASTDRSADLASVLPNSILRFEVNPLIYLEYLVIDAPINQGTYYEYNVLLIDQSGIVNLLDVTTVTATIPIPTATSYVEIASHWAGNQPPFATVSGILQYDGVDQLLPNSAFGVDIRFQRANKSPDWDIVALSAASSSASTLSTVGAKIESEIQVKTRVIESLALVTTNNLFAVSPVVKLNVTENIEAGDYFVIFAFEPGSSVNNRSVIVALYIDGVLVDNPFSMEPKTASNLPYPNKVIPMTFTNGDHIFRVDFGKAGGGGAASVSLENVRILVARR